MLAQRGVALISVMLVVAVATIAAVSMASRQYVDIRRSSNIAENDQAYLFALGVESWAQKILVKDLTESEIDSLGEDWAMILPPLAVEGATISGRIEDQTGRLNLNNLIKEGKASTADVALMKRLFEAVGIDAALVSAIVDWIDADEIAIFPGGAEDDVYLAKVPSYRTPNTMMMSVSELLLINGFDRKTFTMLSPYLTALPKRTTVNINTAAAPVLMALVDGLNKDEAEQLLNDRGDDGFENIEVFKKHNFVEKYYADPGSNQALDQSGGSAIKLDNKTIGISSNYFMLQATSSFGRAEYQMRSLVERNKQGVNVIFRTQEAF